MPITYAIGDVHGEAERLKQLHHLIFERHEFSFAGASIRIVHLGDYVDRGPDSCGVIECIFHLMERGDCEVISLRGNHEQMLLDALSDTTSSSGALWLQNGGQETLESYVHRGHASVLDAHIDWIANLPTLYADFDMKVAYVHAGIDVNSFPNCPEAVRLWTRAPAFYDTDSWSNPNLEGWRIVHGHTPTDDFFPGVYGDKAQRINLDTGAVFGGRLTAGIFASGDPVSFIYA